MFEQELEDLNEGNHALESLRTLVDDEAGVHLVFDQLSDDASQRLCGVADHRPDGLEYMLINDSKEKYSELAANPLAAVGSVLLIDELGERLGELAGRLVARHVAHIATRDRTNDRVLIQRKIRQGKDILEKKKGEPCC